MTVVQGKIQVRRDGPANWASSNPVLALGEIGYDTTVFRFKIGNGTTPWKALGWATDTPLIPPPSTGWTALNSGSVTDAQESRLISLATASGDSIQGEVRTLTPSSNYTATFYFEWALPVVGNPGAGIVLRNSGSGSLVTFGLICDNTPSGFCVDASKWTSVTSFSAYYLALEVWKFPRGMPNWLRIRDDNTNRFFEYSYNGVDWVQHGSSVSRTDFITPDQIGWFVDPNYNGTNTATARLRHFSGVS